MEIYRNRLKSVNSFQNIQAIDSAFSVEESHDKKKRELYINAGSNKEKESFSSDFFYDNINSNTLNSFKSK